MSKLSTGIKNLDREIDDGIPEGFLTSIVAPPSSNAERLVQQFISANDHQAVYITTEKSEPFLKDSIDKLNILTNHPQIVDITGEKDPLNSIEDYIRKLPEESLVIIDSVDILEHEDRARYQEFLNKLQKFLSESGSIAILYGSSSDVVPTHRPLTLKLSDAVFEINVNKESENIISYLSITKFRGLKGVDERIRLEIRKDKVSIDTSRDIA